MSALFVLVYLYLNLCEVTKAVAIHCRTGEGIERFVHVKIKFSQSIANEGVGWGRVNYATRPKPL